ncbi:MAG: hypothetical protein ACJAVF_004621 [Paraglaciecola sp.]|jgi:hypothetical protein
MDMQTSPWRRFAAMSGINSFHGKLAYELENEKDDAKITALKNTDAIIVKLIESVKNAEENDRLKAMYLRFPIPEVKE